MAAADEPPPDAASLPGAGDSPRRRSLRRRGPRPMLLEQRFMFDGAAAAVAGVDMLRDAGTEAQRPAPGRAADVSVSPSTEPVAYGEQARGGVPPAAPATRQLLFVDAAVPARAALAAGVRPGVEVVLLDSASDPWAQMTQAVCRHAQLDAIHLLSHGAAGRLMLSGADGHLDDALSHPAAADSLAQWRGHLAPEADILIYGCDVAGGVAGQHSVGLIARLTGADVAASTDTTGAAALGGDWVLEARTGPVEAALPFDPDALAPGHWVLAAPISTSLNVVEGAPSTLVGREAFPAVDPAVTADSAAAQQIVYTLTSSPQHGRLELAGQAIGQDSTFTHAQVLNGELIYVHTAAGGSDQNTPDQFAASVNNPVAPGPPKDVVVSVTITPVNQAPTVGGGALAFEVFEGQPFGATSDGLARSVVGLAIFASGGGDPGDTTLDLRIASLPAHGLLHYAGPARLNGEPVTINRVLTAADLAGAGFVIAYADRGGLRYQHDGLDVGGVPPADGFDVVVTDGGGGTAQALSARATIAIKIDAVSDNPVLDPASTLAATVTINGPNQVIDGGGDDYRVVIGPAMLRVTDADTADANLSFFITRLPQDGRLLLNNTELAAGASFTMADVAAGRLQYVQTALNDGGANPQDDFALVVRDGTVSLHWDAAGEDHLRPGGLYTGSQPGDPLQTLNFRLTLAPTSAGSGGSGSADPTPAPTSRLTTQYVGRPPTGQALGTLVEGGAVTIGRDMLQHGAGNVSADQIVYTLVGFGGTAGPWNGSLQRNGVALKVLDSFTQADIDAGRIRFVHDGGEDFASTVDFVVSAAGAREVTAATLALYAEPVNDLPTAVAAGALTVAEGSTIVISSARLALTDADDADSETHLENAPGDTTDQHGVNFALDNGVWGGDPLRWRVESLPTAGRLQVDVTGQGAWTDIAASDVAGKTLYDASLPEAGRLRYVHDGFESRNDSFRLVMRDRWGAEGAVTTVSFVITNANDAPEIAARPTLPDPDTTGRAPNLAGGAAVNQPLTGLAEGGRARLTTAMLQAYDPDSSAVQVQYRITSAPSTGLLQHSVDGTNFTTLGVGASFSQKQVQDGQIYYLHDGSEPASSGYPGAPDDRFVFTLSDGAREPTGNEFWIYVEPLNDVPTLAAEAAPLFVEAADARAQTLAASGRLDLDDGDTGEHIVLAAVYDADAAWSAGTLDAAQIAALTTGTFRVDPVPTELPATLRWHYAANGVPLDFLGHGETISFGFTVSAVDRSNASAASSVRIQVEGRNDAPVVVDSRLSTELTEGATSGAPAALRSSGWLQFSDADAKDRVSASAQFLGVSAQGGALVDAALAGALANALTLAGDGVFAAARQGTLNWTFALDDALVRQLAQGQSLTASWRVALTDDSGATDAGIQRTITVTIHGANSAPTLSVESPVNFVEALDARAQTLEQSGTLQAVDPDSGARLRLEARYNGDLQWSGGTLAPSIVSALTSTALTLSTDELDASGSARWAYRASGLNLDFLAPGETVRFSYTVSAADTSGATAAATLTFTLVGTGETPDLSVVDLTGSVTEDRTSGTPAQLRDSGLAGFAGLNGGVPPTVTSQLLDATPTGSAAVDALWTAALAAAFDTGELQVDTATGLGLVPWTFSLDNGLAQGLGAGDSIVARWRILLASDPTVSEVVTVTVVGVNDAPTIAAATLTGAVVEDQTSGTPGRLRAAGSLDFADTDRGDRIQAGVALHSLSATSGLAIGPTLTTALAQAMTLEGAGTDGAAESGRVSWAFGLDNGLVQHLGKGDAITAIWRMSLTDDSGSTRATSFRDLVVTITGANDAPAIVSVDVLGGVTAGVTTGTPALLRDSGSIDFTDVDATDLLSAGVALHGVVRGNGAPADAALDAALAQALTLTGPGATTKANAGTLVWAFALDSALAQSLAPGQTVTATWRVSLGDDSGGPDAIRTQDVVVTLTGANDAPSIVAADLDGEVVEDTTSGTPALLRDSGTLVFADSDSGQLVRADVVWLGSSASAGVTVSSALAQALASALTLSGDGLGAGTPAGTLRWDFALDDALAQTLGAGDRVTGTWRIRLDDGSGGAGAVSTRDLHITVVGANDAPAVLSADLEGAVTEDLTAGAPAMLREAGTLAWADADATDLARVSVATPTMTGSPGVLLDHPDGFALSMALAQALTVSGPGTGATAAAAAGGSVGWVFALDPAYTQFLGADESVTVTWRLTLTDDSGRPNASTARDLVITIHGRNDMPTVSAVDVEGTVGADQVTGSPARLRDSGSVHFSDPDRLDRVQASVALQGVVRHGGAPADAALDDALAQALTLSGPGSSAPSPAGTLGWAFELDPAFAQALAPGQTVTATWRISFTDDSGGPGTNRTQDVSITIIGANDAPVVGAADLTGLLTEDMPSGEPGQLRDGGTLAFSDPDAGQRVRAEFVWLGSSASAGLTVSGALADALRNALTLSGDGLGAGAAAGTLRWDVALDNALVQSLGAGDSVVARWQLRLADDANPGGAVVTRELTVTVEGRNDAPTDLGESRDVGLGQTVSGPLLTANSSDVDGDTLRLHSVDGVGFSELAASADPAHPADEGWRQRTLEHGTLYVQQDGRADYRHGGRSFLVTPLDVPGRLEIRQQDGTWIELQGPVSISLDALRSGGLRYTPAASEGTLALATVAKITERDWRSDGFTYRVSDGQAASAPVQAAYTVTSGRELLGSDIRPAPDGDVDGIASRVEAALAGRVTGLDGLQPRPHVLLPAHLGLATGGDGYTLTLRAEFEGDLNEDGVADAFQPAVTTFAWTSHVQFEIANADPAALESTRPIVTLVAAANLDETPTAHANVQLSAVEVRSMSAAQSAAFEARFGFSSLWSPLTFGARLASDAGAGAAPVDVDPGRDGAQWRFTIDLSRSGEMASDFVGYVKWVDQATIDAYRNAGLDLLDLDGRAIDSPGFVDFTRRDDGGDGARLHTDAEGRLWLDIVITDNRFGDADLALGRIVDPGMPAFVNEADDRRPLTVSSPAVNEASPWACFEVSGAARQIVSLSLVAGSATGGGVDFGSTDARNLQVSIDGGQTWVDHASGTVQLPESGRLLARTPVVDDRFHDPAETIVLEARTTGGSLFSGTATVRDDGAGVVFRADGSIDTHAWRSDDRPASPPTAPLRAAAASAVVTSSPMTATGFADLGRTAIAAFDSTLQPTRPSTLLPERPPPGDTLTSAAGFRVVVVESSRPGLSVYQPVADQIFPSNRTATFSIPSDTFAHTAPDAVLRLEARLSNGRGLPAWIQFDARTGTFTVTPPAGFAGELELRVTARDQDGREASTVVKIKVTSGVMVNPGRPSLSEQLGTATPGGRQTASLPRAIDRSPGGTDRSDANALPRARR